VVAQNSRAEMFSASLLNSAQEVKEEKEEEILEITEDAEDIENLEIIEAEENNEEEGVVLEEGREAVNEENTEEGTEETIEENTEEVMEEVTEEATEENETEVLSEENEAINKENTEENTEENLDATTEEGGEVGEEIATEAGEESTEESTEETVVEGDSNTLSLISVIPSYDVWEWKGSDPFTFVFSEEVSLESFVQNISLVPGEKLSAFKASYGSSQSEIILDGSKVFEIGTEYVLEILPGVKNPTHTKEIKDSSLFIFTAQ
jgi:hypothetical protein